MNYKLNSYLSILAIACAVAVPLLSANAHELPVQAALTAPASFDYKYTYSSFHTQFMFTKTTFSAEPVSYVRTADGAYYNYTSTIDSDNTLLSEGLEITMTFNRSNTTWTNPSGSIYRPSDTKIGSNNTVGSPPKKLDFTLDNQSLNDYYLYLDFSSTSHAFTNFRVSYDTLFIGGWTTGTEYPVIGSNFTLIYIPSFTLVNFYIDAGADDRDKYFDAWYLKDLGLSSAYDAGYDAGYDIGEADGYEDGLGNNPNILINATESLIGMFVNFTFILFSLELFGVSILSVVGVLFGIVAIVWILKTIRG
jgi:hypothetical protein